MNLILNFSHMYTWSFVLWYFHHQVSLRCIYNTTINFCLKFSFDSSFSIIKKRKKIQRSFTHVIHIWFHSQVIYISGTINIYTWMSYLLVCWASVYILHKFIYHFRYSFHKLYGPRRSFEIYFYNVNLNKIRSKWLGLYGNITHYVIIVYY